MFKIIILTLICPIFSAFSEELSGPSTIYSIEKYDNINNAENTVPLSFNGYGKIPMVNEGENKTVIEESPLVGAGRKLLEEKPYQATLSFINRRTNILTTLEFTENKNRQDFKRMYVYVFQCLKNYKNILGNDIAFIEISDVQSNVLFTGWLYKKRPSAHVFEHPIYSLSLLSCS